MEYQDEDLPPPKMQRGLSGQSWKGEVIDLTHPNPISSNTTVTQKRVIDVDQDDHELSVAKECHENGESTTFEPPQSSPAGSQDSICSNFGSDGPQPNTWPEEANFGQPAASQHPIPSQYHAPSYDGMDSEMSSDYEPEYEPGPNGAQVGGFGDELSDDYSQSGFEYDYPYSESDSDSDSDFSAGQDSESEAAEPSDNWGAMPDLSEVVTGLTNRPVTPPANSPSPASMDKPAFMGRELSPSPSSPAPASMHRPASMDKPASMGRALSPSPSSPFPASMHRPAYMDRDSSPSLLDDPLFLSLPHPREVQLATPKSNKSMGDTDEACQTCKLAEAPWYPADKADFFEARKENRVAVVSREDSRLAISYIVDDIAPEGKGKRKAEAISSTTEEELTWDASEAQKAEANGGKEVGGIDEDEEGHEPAHEPMQVQPSTEVATEIAVTVESLDLPVSVATSTLRLEIDSGRPAKRQRLRNIAERVGFVALGGVATGAMMFGALVYTAPTFV